MILRTISILLLSALGIAAFAMPALGQSSQNIAATVSVQSVAITVSPNSVNYGTLVFAATKSSSQLTPPVTFTATNAGNVNVSVKAYGANASAAGADVWTITPGPVTCPGAPLNTFAHGVTPTGGTEALLSSSTGGSTLSSSVVPGSSVSFTSKLYMPCPGSAGVGQTLNTTITVFATAN